MNKYETKDRRLFAKISKKRLEVLRDALYEGKIPVLKKYLNLGWNPRRPLFGCNPLAITDDPNLAEILLDSGVDPDKAFTGMPPLLHRAANGPIEMVRFLLKAGADINVRYERKDDLDLEYGVSPLIIAISHNQINIAKFLIKKGADINLEDRQGHNALFYAVRSNQAERTKLAMELVRRGSKLNDDVLCGPVFNANIKLIKFLLAKGANPSVVFGRLYRHFKMWPEGETLLGCAIGKINSVIGYPPTVAELLIKAGADVNQPSKGVCWYNGKLDYRPIPPIRIAGGKGQERILELLWKAGARGTIQEAMADCSLERAAYRNSPEVVRLLVRAGVDVNEVGKESGKRAIELAREKGHVGIIRILKRAGATD